MDPFDEWAKSTTEHTTVRKYADLLVALGTSWDSFLSRDPESIAEDLVQGGIPTLAARDIVDVASHTAKRNQAPMAIFWDIENMPIPTTSSGRDVCSRLKMILRPYGELAQFRGYASIGLNQIPQQKRSDLQLSGCLLVDCPHNGRKEVADKMIIVDAMNFAMLNPNGATLCFVTGDTDYAYLLAVLQRYKQYRTIVISKGTLQSMLDVNCDMKMRWETDILQLRSSAKAWENTALDLGLPEDGSASFSESNTVDEINPFEPLTADEEWIDDAEFLRNLVRREVAFAGCALKANIGNFLRQTNPARFPQREAVQHFLATAIERKVVAETGEGALKMLVLPTDETAGMFPAISLTTQPPISSRNIPERVKEIARLRPYVLFVKWKFCPSGTKLPSKAFVQHKDEWGILLFQKLTCAQQLVSELTWLRSGILVDWRKVPDENTGKTSTGTGREYNTALPGKPGQGMACSLCRSIRGDVKLVPLDNRFGSLVCPECKEWDTTTSNQRDIGAEKVVKLLDFMALHDDIVVPENILRKQVHLKDDFRCESRKMAALWIQHAHATGKIKCVNNAKLGKTKPLRFCLPRMEDQVARPPPPEDFDTRAEEECIVHLLWDGVGWINRLDAIQAMKQTFNQKMSHPFDRTRVIQNAQKSQKFFLAKSPYAQVIGLTYQGAEQGIGTFHPRPDAVLPSSTPSEHQHDASQAELDEYSSSDASADA